MRTLQKSMIFKRLGGTQCIEYSLTHSGPFSLNTASVYVGQELLRPVRLYFLGSYRKDSSARF